MCGKFTQMMSWGAYVTLADLMGSSNGAAETVTPMRFATVIRRGVSGAREAVRMRWGLVPPGAKDPNASPFIHARAETIDERTTFAAAFQHRRGLVVVKTFNEGKEITPSKTEQHVITPDDGALLAIAVIWERWGELHGAALETFAMVTVPANRLIAAITDRMPAIVSPQHWAKWLGEEPASLEELKAILVPLEGNWSMRPEKPPRPREEDAQLQLL
jgi:putative SOS response-associated peptidase YedK